MDLRISGKTGLVTGRAAASGAAARWRWVTRGRLALIACRRQLLEEVADQIVGHGGAAPLIIDCDLMRADAPEEIAGRALAELGAVEILVNNAGGSRPFGLNATGEQWDEAITVNFTRQRQLTHRLLPDYRRGHPGRPAGKGAQAGRDAARRAARLASSTNALPA